MIFTTRATIKSHKEAALVLMNQSHNNLNYFSKRKKMIATALIASLNSIEDVRTMVNMLHSRQLI